MIKLYGPYLRRDGRRHLVLYDTKTKKRTSKSYAKHLLEQKLGRELIGDETADHIDGNPSNDSPDNIQLLTRADNSKKSILPAPKITFYCPLCNKKSTKNLRDVHHNRMRGKVGPFCSRSCAGRYSTNLQYGRRLFS